MPEYVFENPNTHEIREVFQKMNDEHVFSTGEDGEKIKWKRRWTVPAAGIDGRIDAYSKNQFIEVTQKKKGTMGNIIDLSKELSEKRASDNMTGKDPVREKWLDDYRSKRNGKEHPLSRERPFGNQLAEVTY